MKTLYLAGPINGCTDEEAKGWREAARSALADRFEILDPMARDYRGIEDAHAQELVEDDLEDIARSDVLLVNATRPSWGTAMEVWQAGLWGKVIVAVCPGPVSPWLRFCALHVVPTMEDAITLLSREPTS